MAKKNEVKDNIKEKYPVRMCGFSSKLMEKLVKFQEVEQLMEQVAMSAQEFIKSRFAQNMVDFGEV